MAGGAHWSNEDATCAHGKLCEVCGYEFTEPTEEHTPGTQWTACGDLYHAHLCTLCGAHCDPEDHEAGPAGTPGADTVCKVCGYVMAEGETITQTTPAATEEPSPDATEEPSPDATEEPAPDATEEPSPDATEPSATDVPSATPDSSGMAEGGENTPPSQNEEPKTDWLLYVTIGIGGLVLILVLLFIFLRKKKK